MQYGYDQQQGYGQQQGYDQQQGYGQQGGYQQQQGYGGGSQALWSIHAFSGVMGHNKFSGAVSELNKDRFRSVCEKYGQLPYTLIGGDERILCRWNIVNDPGTSVSRSQCKVSLYPDGTAVLTSMGSCSPTLWRSQGGPWNALYKDQTQVLTSGDQVGLDANNPESAVFTCQNEAVAMQQGGGYQQQGGYGY